MEKKSIIKTALAGIGVGCLVGIKVALDIYDFGYQTRVKEEMGDKAAKTLNTSIQEVRGLLQEVKKTKANKN